MKNQLFYGDNLDILKRYVEDESVDLVYLDPPFKSNQVYNVLFRERSGKSAAAQIKAFEDTWQWNEESARTFEDVVENGATTLSKAMQGFRLMFGENDMLAYLSMMAPRLAELKRVLKRTGSIYLHCDSAASAHLRLLMDAIFGHEGFRNEIIWKRTSAHSDPRRYGANVDSLLFYTKTAEYTWNQIHTAHSEKYLSRFRNVDEDGRRWTDDNLTAKGLTGGGYDYEYKGVRSLWRCPPATMEALDAQGKLHFTDKGGIRLKRYLEDTEGVVLQAVWIDIPPINSQAQERLGYPTQKPEALLERILTASSNNGDTILDPFCGCGTAIAVAQRLKRKWIGIDITHLAIGLIKYRLHNAFGNAPRYSVIGEPVSIPDAIKLSNEDRFQFQFWALGLVNARPAEEKRGADKGIDGRLFFHDDNTGETRQIIFSVKSGKVSVRDIRDLRGVIEREEAEIGCLITLEQPTSEMTKEAATSGFYYSKGWNKKYSRVQILTIEELLAGKQLDSPPNKQVNVTFKKAKKQLDEGGEQIEMLGQQEIVEMPSLEELEAWKNRLKKLNQKLKKKKSPE